MSTTDLTITRFDVFDRTNDEDGELTVLRLFAKRKLAGELDVNDCREDFEDALPEFLAAKPRNVTQVMDFLGEEPSEESDEDDSDGESDEDDSDGESGGSIVPEKYRVEYGVTQRCGDDIAETLSSYTTLPRATKKDIDGGLDRAKLAEVAAANGLSATLDEYLDRGLNGGLLRMNISNILRGMERRGEKVVIGDRLWEADPSKMEARKAAKKAKRAEKAAAKKAAKAK